jgi:hypothetical protein
MQRQHDGRNDFDFLIGRWKVHHRILRERLKGSSDWTEFDGTVINHEILAGIGNTDEFIMDLPTGRVEALALRLFNPHSREWSIHWASSTTGVLDTPMIGQFKDGRGEFFAQELHDGRHVFSRFIWSEITGNSCRWEQALSEDGGRTWETNWIMEFTRIE